jgi:hypothetical protein
MKLSALQKHTLNYSYLSLNLDPKTKACHVTHILYCLPPCRRMMIALCINGYQATKQR